MIKVLSREGFLLIFVKCCLTLFHLMFLVNAALIYLILCFQGLKNMKLKSRNVRVGQTGLVGSYQSTRQEQIKLTYCWSIDRYDIKQLPGNIVSEN